MRRVTRRLTEGGRVRLSLAVLACVAAVVGVVVPATTGFAAFSGTKVPGSNFEIDADANFVQDDASPSVDWLQQGTNTYTTGVRVTTDTVSGPSDESFGNGSKEDTAVPSVVDGGIPPNKSDLKAFGLYIEAGRFLNLFWTRVQDPEGTTNMDFEFNQSTTLTANNFTPVRTPGDFLITYDLSRGGTNPTISVRKWLSTNKWGPAVEISEQNPVEAAGSINTQTIAEGAADQVGPLDPRTFGEATIDLEAVFGNSCGRIGAAYLKSRSSDSFTAALKDFVPPDTGINFNNCPPAAPVTTQRVQLSDSATVGSLGHPGTLTFSLLRAELGDTTPCAGATTVTVPSSFANIPVSTTGTASTPGTVDASVDGIYNWVVSYTPGAGAQLLAGSSSCGSEQVVVDQTNL